MRCRTVPRRAGSGVKEHSVFAHESCQPLVRRRDSVLEPAADRRSECVRSTDLSRRRYRRPLQ